MTHLAQRSHWPRRTAAIALLLVAGILAPTPIGPMPVQAVTAPSARWTFDAGSGDTVADAVGTAHGTRAGGATWIAPGAAGSTGALHFDGVDGRVEVPNASSLEPADLTLTVWVRGNPASPPSAGQVIVEKGAFACDGPSYGIYVAEGGIRLSARYQNGEQINGTLLASNAKTSLWDGAWHLVSAHLRRVSNAMYGYLSIDNSPHFNSVLGRQDGPVLTTAVKYTDTTTSDLRIGGRVNPACAPASFSGDVDDVRLYADPFFDPGTLMPPIAESITAAGPATAHPGSLVHLTAHVSPVPRWGEVAFEFLKNGTWQSYGRNAVDANGNASDDIDIFVDEPFGTKTWRATYVGYLPYQPASSQSFSLVVAPYPTTTALTASPSPATAFGSTTLTATVTSGSTSQSLSPVGSVSFYDTTPAIPVLLGTSSLTHLVAGKSRASLKVSTLAAGTHKLVAQFVGPDPIRAGSTSPVYTLTVNKATSAVTLTLGAAAVLETHHSIPVEAVVWTSHGNFASGGTITFRRVGATTPACVVPVDPGNVTKCTFPSYAVGTWQFTATYSGNANTLGSTSALLTVNIAPDVVHATGVGVQYTTFYPYVDAYKDTVAITGTRQEAIGVTIKIYNPAGTLIRTSTVASGIGAYSWAWNGRNSAGTWYAEGTYKIVQSLRDAAGTIKDYTFSVALSKKRVYTTTKTIVLRGSSVSAKGFSGGGSVTLNTTSGYALLKSPNGGWAGAGWEFTLPPATAYHSLKFQVYAKGGSAVPPTYIAVQNFAICPYVATIAWDTSCFNRWVAIGASASTSAWYSTTANLATDKSGTKVRGIVSQHYGTIYVYKAQVVITYGELRY